MKGWIAHWSTNHWCLFRQFRAVSQIWSLEAQLNSGQDVQRCHEQWQIILGPQFCFQMSYSNSFYRFGIYLKNLRRGALFNMRPLKKMSMIYMIWCNTIWSLLFWDWDCFSVPSLRPVILVDGRWTFLMAMHPRLGANSPARQRATVGCLEVVSNGSWLPWIQSTVEPKKWLRSDAFESFNSSESEANLQNFRLRGFMSCCGFKMY